MSFKGKPNLAGRKPGSKNKTTDKIRNAFALLIEDNLEQLQDDVKRLRVKDRVNFIIQLAKFIIPTYKAIEQPKETKQVESVNFSNLIRFTSTRDEENEKKQIEK